jgi:hypothetical protein
MTARKMHRLTETVQRIFDPLYRSEPEQAPLHGH